jgi:hypothetical protein
MAEIPIERKPRRSFGPLLLILILILVALAGWYWWTNKTPATTTTSRTAPIQLAGVFVPIHHVSNFRGV